MGERRRQRGCASEPRAGKRERDRCMAAELHVRRTRQWSDTARLEARARTFRDEASCLRPPAPGPARRRPCGPMRHPADERVGPASMTWSHALQSRPADSSGRSAPACAQHPAGAIAVLSLPAAATRKSGSPRHAPGARRPRPCARLPAVGGRHRSLRAPKRAGRSSGRICGCGAAFDARHHALTTPRVETGAVVEMRQHDLAGRGARASCSTGR